MIWDLLTLVNAKTLKKMSNKRKTGVGEVEEDTEESKVEEDTAGMPHLEEDS